MNHAALTPVFVGLRTALHVLLAGLAALVIVRALVAATSMTPIVVGLTVALVLTYVVGARLAPLGSGRGMPALLWLGTLTAEWLVLVWLTPEASYLVFPLFFLYLHLLTRWWGVVCALVATALAIVALGVHSGWTLGGVIGPIVGAGVAIVISLGYRSLGREAAEREALMAELLATRDQLAVSERRSGVLDERSRLAREIHDTVAQGLSSIQMLLHAAQRADPASPALEYVVLARQTAATNLAETRRFIRELSPVALVGQGIGAALHRLANTEWSTEHLAVTVRVSEALALPMEMQTALLRVTQGAMSNVVRHAEASHATITLDRDRHAVRLTVADNGRGFDAEHVQQRSGHSDSFGLTAARERIDQLGGTFAVQTSPGAGTTLVVELTLDPEGTA